MSVPLPIAAPEEVGLSAQRLARIDTVFADAVARGRLPGVVSLVARQGKIVHFSACGVGDPATGAAMTKDALFRIYSMSKPIVSVAIMRLVEEGRLLLADPIAKHLPGFAAPKVARAGDGGKLTLVPAERVVTVQDLLRHTSGYTYEHSATGELQRLYREAKVTSRRDMTNAELASRLATVPLAFEPGTQWRYGHSTDLLGRIVEVVAGERLGTALAAMILRPLGMSETAFSVPAAQHHRIGEPFAQDPDGAEVMTLAAVKEAPLLESGGGGLVSTASDYARFVAMLAGGGTLDGARILGRKSIEQMRADHLGATPGEPPLPPGYGFGLGFAVRREAGLANFAGSQGEYFWSGVAGTTFWIDPAEELFAIFMSQAPGQREYHRMLFRNLVYASLID
jgi:CubicO group peptidase (beta-lactamase class C family)